MGSGAAVRAGRAFVEMVLDDSTVKESLERVKTQLRTFGTAVDSTATASLVQMNTVATATTTRTTAGVGILAASMGVLQATAYAVGNAFRVAFGIVTTSVFRAIAGVGVLTAIIARVAPGSRLSGFLNGFLSRSQTTEAIGRWTRFAGSITGSSVLRDMGNRIERLGLGSAIVKGFQGGVISGIASTFGAGIRSAKSVVAGGLANIFTAPLRGVSGLFQVAMSRTGVSKASPAVAASPLAAIGSSAGASTALAAGLTRASGAAWSLNGALGMMKSIGASIAGVAIKVGGLAAAISGPALLAAKNFVNTAASIMKAAKDNGTSIGEEIRKKFGDNGLVSEKDIRAGAEISDLFDRLKQSVASAWSQIGAAALPIVKQITEKTIAWTDAIGEFLALNREFIAQVVDAAVKVAGFASGIILVYTGFSALLPIVAALVSPLGLVAAGIAAIAYFFPRILTEAMAVFQFLFGNFAQLGTIVNQTIQGMQDALAGGSLTAAARVMWAGLNLAWLTGSANLRAVWRTMITGMSSMFIDLYAAILKGWVVVTSTFMSIWTTTQNWIAQGMARLIAAWTGQNEAEVLATLTQMQQQDQSDREKAAKKRLDEIEAERKAQQDANKELDKEAQQRADEELKKAQEEFEAARKAAADARGKRDANLPGVASSLKRAETFGSFSIAGVGRTNVGGINELKSIDDNTKKMADNSGKNPFEWVA